LKRDEYENAQDSSAYRAARQPRDSGRVHWQLQHQQEQPELTIVQSTVDVGLVPRVLLQIMSV
jgi:hypothetical protein